MDKKELRIGNTVNEFREPNTVTVNNITNPHFKPIPLIEL